MGASGKARTRKVNISSGLLWLFWCALKNKEEKRSDRTTAQNESRTRTLLLCCFLLFHAFLSSIHSFIPSQTHSHPPTHSCFPSLWIYPLVSLLFWLETSPLHYYLTTNTEQFAKLINGLLFCNTDECFAGFFLLYRGNCMCSANFNTHNAILLALLLLRSLLDKSSFEF